MADSQRLQPQDDNDDDDDLPPPIPAAFSSKPPAPAGASNAPPPSDKPRIRQRANSWTAPAAVPPPLPSAPLPVEHSSQTAAKLLQKSLEALQSERGRRTSRPQSDADVAFEQLVAAATEAKTGVGIRISPAQPVTCTAVIEGHSAAHHPLSSRFVGCRVMAVDNVDVASKTQEQVRELVLGAFGSICSVRFMDAGGRMFSADLLRANPEFFTSYEEQVKRLGSMVSPSVSAAVQAQNAALQQKVVQLQQQLREAEDKVDLCTRTLENAHQSVKMQEESLALSKILEEESTLSEISSLEARVQQLMREVALKDSIINRHDKAVLADTRARDESALKAEIASLESKCAALQKENLEIAAERRALDAKLAAQHSAAEQAAAAQNNESIRELVALLSDFEVKVPKLSAKVAQLEAELVVERRHSSSKQEQLDSALARESILNDRLQLAGDQLQQAAARALQALSSRPPRQRDAVFDCHDDAGDDAWAAAVQRHAVSIVLSTAVERVVARASTRSLFERHQQQLALACLPPAAAVIAHDVGVQAGTGDASHVITTVALDFSQCLDRIAKAAELPLPSNLCTNAVHAMIAALVNDDCSACTLTGVEAWCTQAADKARSFEMRAIASEGERDSLLHFSDQMQQENARLVLLHQAQQLRHKDVECAMLASVNDVQQLSQQMGSLLTIIKDKSAENSDLARQVTRLKQMLTIQTDMRQQIEGQKQQLLQYQVVEREALQLKMSRDDAVQRVEQLEHDLLASQQAQREMENDLFRAREMLMDAEARLFSMGEDKARLQAERDSAEAAVLAFNFLRSGKVSSKPLSLSSSNRQLPPLPASLELLAFDMKDSSASALQQAQALFDSLTSLAACSQLFSAALDLCERSIMHASEQGLRMSNELRYLTEQCSSKAEQSSELFAQQLEANSASAVVIAARMHDVMMAMKAQHSDLTSRYETFLSQYTVFEHAVAEADKGAKHLQWLVKRRLMLHKEGSPQASAVDGDD